MHRSCAHAGLHYNTTNIPWLHKKITNKYDLLNVRGNLRMSGSSQIVRMPNVQASLVMWISSPGFTDATPSDLLVKVLEALAVFDIQRVVGTKLVNFEMLDSIEKGCVICFAGNNPSKRWLVEIKRHLHSMNFNSTSMLLHCACRQSYADGRTPLAMQGEEWCG